MASVTTIASSIFAHGQLMRVASSGNIADSKSLIARTIGPPIAWRFRKTNSTTDHDTHYGKIVISPPITFWPNCFILVPSNQMPLWDLLSVLRVAN